MIDSDKASSQPVAKDGELGDEIVLRLVRRALDELELETGNLDMPERKVVIGVAQVRRRREDVIAIVDGCLKIAPPAGGLR